MPATGTAMRLIVKLMASFFIVFLLFVPWQGFVGHWPYEAWYHIVIDFLGVADLFNTPTMNATWWYVSIALICYALTPLFSLLLKEAPELSITVIVCILFICNGRIYRNVLFEYTFWVCNYLIGMTVYRYSLFDRLMKLNTKHFIYRWIICLPIVFAVFWLRFNRGISFDPLFAVTLIGFSAVCLSGVPVVGWTLQLIGKHSGNIFMMHTFIYLYNLSWLVYSLKYAPLIYILCVCICLAVSVAIEWLKKTLRVNELVLYITRKIEGKFSPVG